jgi:DNA-binding transcriptional regulator YhcF (GntR family)
MTREVLRQSLSFHLSPASGVPAYLQIVQQVRQALQLGLLNPGDKLPTVKDVVAEVTINPNTVMKAYWQLEHEGLVEGRQGVGTFVVRRPPGPPPHTQIRLARRLQAWMRDARAEGMDDDGIESMMRTALSGARAEGIA